MNVVRVRAVAIIAIIIVVAVAVEKVTVSLNCRSKKNCIVIFSLGVNIHRCAYQLRTVSKIEQNSFALVLHLPMRWDDMRLWMKF